MKFVYVDETADGGNNPNGVFVMVGLMVDAHKLRKVTSFADEFMKKLLEHYGLLEVENGEMKTSSFLNGKNIGGVKMSNFCPEGRKKCIMNLCQMIPLHKIKIYGIALLFKNFDESVKACKESLSPKTSLEEKNIKNKWYISAVFLSSLIQKKMATQGNKGLTVLIFDDNKQGKHKISEFLKSPDAWFDLFSELKNSKLTKKKSKRNSSKNKDISEKFDKIINTAFSIKSHHSSLIQFADAVSYAYRRWLELKNCEEEYQGEKEYYQKLINILEHKENRIKIGKLPNSECANFYKKITHPDWVL